MIETATQEQWDEIEKLRQRWMDEQTETRPLAEIEAAAAAVWKLRDLPAPKVVLCPSPLDAARRHKADGGDVDADQYWSIWWQVWAAWYQGGEILGVEFDQEKLQALVQWSRCCGYVVGTDEQIYVSERPVEIHWLDGVLHNESGMAVRYRDGWGTWSIEGIPVDEQIVLRPETQTLQQLEQESNADVRQIRIARYGWAKYLKETGATLIDSRKNDVSGTTEALYECDMGRRIVFVCDTGRVFAPGVPDSVSTCEEAQTWLAGDGGINVISST